MQGTWCFGVICLKRLRTKKTVLPESLKWSDASVCVWKNIKQSLCVQAGEGIYTAQVLLRAQCGFMTGTCPREYCVLLRETCPTSPSSITLMLTHRGCRCSFLWYDVKRKCKMDKLPTITFPSSAVIVISVSPLKRIIWSFLSLPLCVLDEYDYCFTSCI